MTPPPLIISVLVSVSELELHSDLELLWEEDELGGGDGSSNFSQHEEPY